MLVELNKKVYTVDGNELIVSENITIKEVINKSFLFSERARLLERLTIVNNQLSKFS